MVSKLGMVDEFCVLKAIIDWIMASNLKRYHVGVVNEVGKSSVFKVNEVVARTRQC